MKKSLTTLGSARGASSRIDGKSFAGAHGMAQEEANGTSGRFSISEGVSSLCAHPARSKYSVLWGVMPAFVLDHLSDETLIADLAALVASERQTTAALLAHLAEVEARDLYRPAACSSMFAYCVRVLELSADAAFKRIRAARVARRHP